MPTRNKVMVVTGGSRGIGRATVLGAARAGWAVAFSYAAASDAAEATAAEARALRAETMTLRADAASEQDTLALFDAAAGMGSIRAVVANAGIVGPKTPLADMSLDRLRGMVETNLVGALLTAREAVRRMSTARGGAGGSLVLISSAAARLGGPNEYVDYAASKGALDTLARGLSIETAAEGVRVNAIRPGLIATDIHASGGQPDRVERLEGLIPMKRGGTAEEVAEGALWLASGAASYVTGAILDITGGR